MTLHREEDESILDFRIRQVRAEMDVALKCRDWPDYYSLQAQLGKLLEAKND